MKIGIIGGGASGAYLAIRIKELNPSFDVTIIEKNDKLLKKVAATGNGRCNYANLGELENKYNNSFANQILNNLKPLELINNFDRYGIHPKQIDELVYPVSLSAQTVVLMLNKKLEQLKLIFVSMRLFWIMKELTMDIVLKVINKYTSLIKLFSLVVEKLIHN